MHATYDIPYRQPPSGGTPASPPQPEGTPDPHENGKSGQDEKDSPELPDPSEVGEEG